MDIVGAFLISLALAVLTTIVLTMAIYYIGFWAGKGWWEAEARYRKYKSVDVILHQGKKK